MRDRLIDLLRPNLRGTACILESGSCELRNCRECKARIIADHLIANGVIVPPCKVGDKIYYIGDGDVQELNIEFITITENGFEYGVDIGDSTILLYDEWIDNDFYFYNKAKAEEYLKQLKALRGEGE